MSTEKRIDFAVVNCLGTTLATFGSLDLAKAWARRFRWLHPSARVERVTMTVERQVVYRPRGEAAKPSEGLAA